MKKIMLGFILPLALFIFGINLGVMGKAQANPLFAQVPQPSATPQSQKQVSPPPLNTPVANQPTPQPSQAPAAAQPKPPKEQSQSSGPYDMEAMKAFNRALYGS
jgi:hypothetical protein